jgi:hypothetical protein
MIRAIELDKEYANLNFLITEDNLNHIQSDRYADDDVLGETRFDNTLNNILFNVRMFEKYTGRDIVDWIIEKEGNQDFIRDFYDNNNL